MADLEDLERRIKHIEDKLGIVNEYPYRFEDIAGLMDQRTLEQIWQGMDTPGIAIALIGLSAGHLLNIKPTFSKKRWNEIVEVLHGERTKEVTDSTIRINREGILDKIMGMESRGEIVVGRSPHKEFVSLEEFNQKNSAEPFVDVQSWLHSTFEKV